MRTKPWTRQEFAAVLDMLRRHSRGQDAVRAHNDIWKTGRSVDSVKNKIEREGKGSLGNYLRVAAGGRSEDLPLPQQVQRLVDILKKRECHSVREVCDALDVSPAKLDRLVATAKAMEYRVEMPTNDQISLNVKAPPIDRLAVHRLPIEPIKGHLRFAVASDIHFASKLHRRECLVDFIKLAYEQGIRTVLVPGDIFAGMNMYRGQMNEVLTLAMEGQLMEAVDGLPRLPGLVYHGIGGNHDEAFMKNAGADIVTALGKRRDDFKTYGFYSALLDLAVPDAKKAVKVELHHPDKAGAYALSYHLQKEIEQIPPGMKPQLLFMGHTHTSVMVPDYRGIAAFYCGTFEDQTLFLKRKHLAPAIGGWLVDVGVAGDGAMRSLQTTWVKYFHSARGSIKGLDLDGFGRARDARLERSLGAP